MGVDGQDRDVQQGLDGCWNVEWDGEGFSSCSSFMDKLERVFANLGLSQAPAFQPQPPVIS